MVTAGAVDSVGGVSVNTSGREKYWSTTWDSYLTSPIVGHGAGSADLLVTDTYGKADHPHNDYLRILHDLGAIGAVLWIAGYLLLLIRCAMAWNAGPRGVPSTELHMTATLGLIAVAIAMITDNVVIYVFAMAPLALVVGMSIGLERRSRHGRLYWWSEPPPEVPRDNVRATVPRGCP